MADLHIDDFYGDAARILVQLFATFPGRELLYVEDLLGPGANDEFGLPSPRYRACFSAMLWLAEEGWLRYEAAIRQDGLDQAVLTQRALLRLVGPAGPTLADSAVPPSVAATHQSRIAALRRALASGDSLAVGGCMQALLARP